jgi:ABC-type multidrug transport system ATPase subunit
MMISLSDAGKRYNRDWIFRRLSYTFTAGNAYAITGPNGSGKSTLLQCIAGAVGLSEGKLSWQLTTLSPPTTDGEQLFRHLSICAPYLEVIEEMTATEFLQFHQRFKPFLPNWDATKIITYIGLQAAANKQIRYFSSGMKQRMKLAQAVFSDTAMVLLDEPCTNFDEAGYALYRQMIGECCQQRLVIVSSNDEKEYGFCNEVLNIFNWKK